MTARTAATLIGFAAVLMWGLLAYLSNLAGAVPPLQLLAMTFLIGGACGSLSLAFRPGRARAVFFQNPVMMMHNVAGLFGSHLLYFTAIQHAPAVEVSLIAYLWPMFIVLFSALLPGQKLKVHHIAGAALGLAGSWMVISKGQSLGLSGGLQSGHLIALPYAIYWAGFSVSIRRYGAVPSDVVAGFCLVTGIAAAVGHFALESTAWPLAPAQWLAIVLLGLLPVGLAFFAWDYGMKHGDPMVLGASAYVAPLLSTLILLATGTAAYHWSIAAACVLISAGAVLAAKDMLLRPVSP